MFCGKCGKKVEEGTKFCPGCGEKVVAKKEEKKVEEKKVVKAEPVKEAPKRKGLAIAGLVLGIIAIILSWFLNLFIIVVPIVGLILAICSGKSALKIVGIILNAVSIVVCFVMFVVSLTIVGRSIGNSVEENLPEIKKGINEVKESIKSGYPYGTWTCVDYYDSDAKNYADNVKLAPSDKKTVLNLYTDNTYKYGPYTDSYKNYYKGSFTYKIETDKNKEYKSKNVSFMDVETTIDEALIDGVSNPNATGMHFEMELLGEKGYDTALILFYNSYNTYYCQR